MDDVTKIPFHLKFNGKDDGGNTVFTLIILMIKIE